MWGISALYAVEYLEEALKLDGSPIHHTVREILKVYKG